MIVRHIVIIATIAALLGGCGAAERSDADANVMTTLDAAVLNSAGAAAPLPATANVAAPANTADAADGPALVIEGEGLRLVDPDTGSARPLPFGTARATLERVLASRGRPETGRLNECGEGPADYAEYPDGLQLLYQDGKFAGWAIDDRGRSKLTTMAGLGIGSTRASIEDAYDVTVEESTIGQEFLAGGVGGLLNGTRPTAKVTNLWAGVACIAR